MAFEQVTLASRVAEFEAKRDAFLENPLADKLFSARCSGLYNGVVRYVRADATGAGDGTGNTASTAWTFSEFMSQQGVVSANSIQKVVFTGKFSLAAVGTTTPEITLDNILLDFREATYIAGLILDTSTQISAGETAGEYKVASSVVINQSSVAMTVNGRRLGGWSRSNGFTNARAQIASVDTGANTITLSGLAFELQNGDPCAAQGGTLGGVTLGSAVYVINAGAYSAGGQTVQLSTSVGGSAIDITSQSGTTFLTTLWSGRNNVPYAGTLQDDEFAFMPWLDTIYFKPAGGLSASDEVVLRQTASADGLIITGSNVHVLGGEFYCSTGRMIEFDGSGASWGGAWGVKAHASADGIKANGADNIIQYLCESYENSNQVLGGYDTGTAERGLQVIWCHGHDNGTKRTDFGDFQGIVTNKASHGAYFAHNILHTTSRDSDIEPYASSDFLQANVGCIILDNSTTAVLFDNYMTGSSAELVEIGVNTDGVSNIQIVGNVFDMRNPRACNVGIAYSPQGIRINQGATGTAVDATVVIAHNLFLMGANTTQITGQELPAGCVSLSQRLTSTQLNPSFYNNVVYAETETNAPCFAFRRFISTSYPTVVSDYNVYAGLQWIGAHFDEQAGASAWPNTTYTAYDSLATWQTATSQDTNSTETTAAIASTWFDSNGRPYVDAPVYGAGAHLGYSIDPDGRLRQNPPTIGVYEIS